MEEFLSEIEYNRLSELLDIVCSNLAEDELQYVKQSTTADLPFGVQEEIKDGRDLAVVLRRNAICDETYLQPIQTALRNRLRYDLLRIVYSHDRKTVKIDPLEEFLLQEDKKAKSAVQKAIGDSGSSCVLNSNGKRQATQEYWDVDCTNQEATCSTSTSSGKRHRTRQSSCASVSTPAAESLESPSTSSASSLSADASSENELKFRYTCDVRLRVWAEYCDHERTLNENVLSNKVDPLERQLERFSQASSILQSRDLGYIVCEIKFSEITYLDAFWRDYLNGSLLEALKGVFITESLKRAVGNEPIKLLVSIDEEDYEEGRNILLSNVYADHAHDHQAGSFQC